jgi:hypothetical protein
MKVVFFAWMPREKPPYFGFRPTWVYVRKIKMDKFSEKKIKKKIEELFEEYGAYDWKVVVYDGFFHYKLYYRIW